MASLGVPGSSRRTRESEVELSNAAIKLQMKDLLQDPGYGEFIQAFSLNTISDKTFCWLFYKTSSFFRCLALSNECMVLVVASSPDPNVKIVQEKTAMKAATDKANVNQNNVDTLALDVTDKHYNLLGCRILYCDKEKDCGACYNHDPQESLNQRPGCCNDRESFMVLHQPRTRMTSGLIWQGRLWTCG